MKEILSKKLQEFLKSIFFVLITFYFIGCAQSRLAKKIVWPLPPEPARVEYVEKLQLSSDVEEKPMMKKLFEFLVGGGNTVALGKPYNVHVTKDGKVLVSDSSWQKVLVFDKPGGKFSILGVDGPGRLDKARGITSDSAGNIYVTDILQRRIIVYDKELKFVRAFGGGKYLERPADIVIAEKQKKLFVSDIGKHDISVFSLSGRFLYSFGERGKEDGMFNYPTGLATDDEGKLYVVDTFNFRVQIFDMNGNFLFKFGNVGTGYGQFAKPKGIAVDSKGHIYVTDAAFNNVQIFDQDGRLLLFFGGFGSADGLFWLPAGIFIDKKDRIYVADQYNRRVNIYKFLGSADYD